MFFWYVRDHSNFQSIKDRSTMSQELRAFVEFQKGFSWNSVHLIKQFLLQKNLFRGNLGGPSLHTGVRKVMVEIE